MGKDARLIAEFPALKVVDERMIELMALQFSYSLERVSLEKTGVCFGCTFCGERYYGPGYTRGLEFPRQAGLMLALIAAGADVYYFADDGWPDARQWLVEDIFKALEYYAQFGTRAYREDDWKGPVLEMPELLERERWGNDS